MKTTEIATIIAARETRLMGPDIDIQHLLTDSRRLAQTDGTLFFAIPSSRNSGVRYVADLYRAGVRSFVVPVGSEVGEMDGANVWYVDDVVTALQQLAARHREQYSGPVIGITGSNGKTVVKDWLVQLLAPEGPLCASPKSFNSQIGVPLSVWPLSESDRMAVFEAGISKVGEMERIERVIRPTIGVITNIGQAHDENFTSRRQKTVEKLKLFAHCSTIVYCRDHADIHSAIMADPALAGACHVDWGRDEGCRLRLVDTQCSDRSTTFVLYSAQTGQFRVTIPFVDRASQENAMHCVAVMLHLGYSPDVIAARCASLTPVEMRLEIIEAIGDSLLINDSYSLDINSLTIALDHLNHINNHPHKALVISDFVQTGLPDEQLYRQVASLVRMKGVDRIVCVGDHLRASRSLFDGIDAQFYNSTDDFVRNYNPDTLQGCTILLKGARVFAFERIAKLLQRKNHETVMEVNLDALIHNLNYYRSLIAPSTKLMAMVKASSYGAGRVEVASALQFNHVDYLTVAYADEGVDLRRGGITLPIMVMNPEEASFDDILNFHLEPDIYSFRILDLFAARLRAKGCARYPIHIEFDTGMHRLGFSGSDVDDLLARIAELDNLVEVRSVFTHLACADDPAMDQFTRDQIQRFRQWSQPLPGIKHILNSSGITRFPEAQLDMVRLGIGLYGISPEPDVQAQLRQVSRLVTRISQIKDIPAGDTVGYNCRWRASRPSRIAILTIGYADGLHRGLGYGRGHVNVGGKPCPIVGSVCMDMCFVDVTDVPCREGDRVVFFGDGDLLQRNAQAADTIPYELLTAVSPRVKRVYYHEE